MATRKWIGQAKDVNQVDTVTIANTWTAGDTITLTIANIDFVVTVGSLITTAQVATTLKEAFNGSALTDTDASCSPTIAQGGAQAIPQFAEFTATIDAGATSAVIFTVDTAGKPATMTATESTASTGTATLANTTAATGKNFFSDQDNWSGNTVPVDGDTIVFDIGSVDCKYGLSPAIQPATVIKRKTYTGKIGLAEVNVDNSSKTYPEYRTKYLTFDDNTATTTYHVEQGDGTGSALVRIDAGAGQVIWNSYGYGTRSVTGQPVQLFIGTHASNVFNVQQGDLGVAFFPDEAATVSAMRVGNGATGGATVVVGPGATTTSAAFDVAGGSLTVETANGSGDIDISGGGSVYINGTAAYADIDIKNGYCYYRSSGTLTTLAVRSAGTFDRSGDIRAATITNAVQLYKGATFKDPHGILTLSGGFKINGGTLSDVTVNVSNDRTYTIA